MLRPSRSLTVWLVWLAIALLPMRAWAGAAMSVDMVAEAAVSMATDVDAPAMSEAASPCHQGSEEAGVADGHSCGLCGVCHSAVVSLPNQVSTLPAMPVARPPIDPSPGVERPVSGGPDRPPRSTLA